MAKRKISSQDFLDMMDEQESSKGNPAFKPARAADPKKKTSAKAKPTAKKAMRKQTEFALEEYPTQLPFDLSNLPLTPLQKEWVQFAIANTPKFVVDLVSSPQAKMLVDTVVDQVERLRKRI